MNKYQVIFRGSVETGQDINEVKQKLAILLFKGDMSRVEWLFSGKKRIIIKKDMDYETASNLKTKLSGRSGAIFEIEEMESIRSSETRKEELSPIANNPIPQKIDTEKMKTYLCPKCQHPFEKGTRFCQQCGYHLVVEFLFDPICPTCQKSFPDGTRFCDIDGSKLMAKDKMIPKCVICGKVYPATTKFCPDDGGQVLPEAQQNQRIAIQLNSIPVSQLTEATIQKYFQAFTWLFCGGCIGLFLFVMTWYYIFLLGIPALFGGVIMSLILQHKAWMLIQSIQPRTTPGKAIGFQFIPLFHLYWGFVAYKGLAEEINTYITRHHLRIPPMSTQLGLAYAILQCVIAIPGINITTLVVYFLFMNALKNSLIAIVKNS